MKILFLTHYYPPEGNAPASRVSALAKRWIDDGHDVTIITSAPNVPDGKVYDGYKNHWTSRETMDGVNVIRIWTYIAPNKGTIRRILNYVSYMISAFLHCLFMKKPDVMIATSPQFFCGWAGVLLHWFRRFPFILEIRDIWPESMVAVNAGLPGPILKIIGLMEKIMYKTAKHIVTVGDGYVERLEERGVPIKIFPPFELIFSLPCAILIIESPVGWLGFCFSCLLYNTIHQQFFQILYHIKRKIFTFYSCT